MEILGPASSAGTYLIIRAIPGQPHQSRLLTVSYIARHKERTTTLSWPLWFRKQHTSHI